MNRLVLAWQFREWPWRIPREVKNIGTKRPPEHVFEAFRKLHGLDQQAAPKQDGEASEAAKGTVT